MGPPLVTIIGEQRSNNFLAPFLYTYPARESTLKLHRILLPSDGQYTSVKIIPNITYHRIDSR